MFGSAARRAPLIRALHRQSWTLRKQFAHAMDRNAYQLNGLITSRRISCLSEYSARYVRVWQVTVDQPFMFFQGRWNALSAARFGGIDINSAENIISLGYGLHKAIDEDFRFAILPVRSILRLCWNYMHLLSCRSLGPYFLPQMFIRKPRARRGLTMPMTWTRRHPLLSFFTKYPGRRLMRIHRQARSK